MVLYQRLGYLVSKCCKGANQVSLSGCAQEKMRFDLKLK